MREPLVVGLAVMALGVVVFAALAVLTQRRK